MFKQNGSSVLFILFGVLILIIGIVIGRLSLNFIGTHSKIINYNQTASLAPISKSPLPIITTQRLVPTVDTSSWKNYTNNDLKMAGSFSLKYPSDWPQPKVTTTITSSKYEFGNQLTIYQTYQQGDEQSLDDYIQKEILTTVFQPYYNNTASKSVITIHGNQGERFISLINNQEKVVSILTDPEPSGTPIIVAFAYAYNLSDQKAANTFDSIISTFKFLDQQ